MFRNILVAPSAYKGTLSATEVADALVAGIQSARPDAVVARAPIADGGDGTLDAINAALGGTWHHVRVTGALGQPVEAKWLELPALGIVELASASGLGMLDQGKLRPLEAHTIGTGEVLLDCLTNGMGEVVVCVGGSASTDGGAGLLSALGARFLDETQEDLPPGGGALLRLGSCLLEPVRRWNGVKFSVATDVTSPLCGADGAAFVFAPQKGATDEQVKLLDQALRKYADVMESLTGISVRDLAGAGAAGGTAFGLVVGLGATIRPGFEWLAELTDLEQKIKESDLVITGEGSLDAQSLAGKATGELAQLCRLHGKQLWVVPARSAAGHDWQRHAIAKVIDVAEAGETATREAVSGKIANALAQD